MESDRAIPDRVDSEGLARRADGSLLVSTEGPARILVLDGTERRPLPLPIPPSFRRLSVNTALEGLAIALDGAIWTVPEAPEAAGFPLWRRGAETWQRMGYLPEVDDFVPVGLDFDDRGRLYVLERRFDPVGGFHTRVLRLDPGDLINRPPERLIDDDRHDNLEGIAVWRNASGELRITMISDDNFFFLQKTCLVEYAVPD